MAKECEARDAELLMLDHGGLSWGRRAITLAHLMRCPECRKRRDELARTSAWMANAIGTGMAHATPGPSVSILNMSALVLAGAMLGTYVGARTAPAAPPEPSIATASSCGAHRPAPAVAVEEAKAVPASGSTPKVSEAPQGACSINGKGEKVEAPAPGGACGQCGESGG